MTSKTFLILFFLTVSATLVAAADSPVEASSPLQTISTDFKLADGPSWDGWALTVLDPFAEQTKRFIPKRKQWLPILSDRRLSGSFYSHSLIYFVDNGKASILRREKNGSITVIHQEDLATDKTRKPNDLVVDRSGGIYFTLTRAGQIVYVPLGKPAVTVANDAKTANGLILSPDESILYASESSLKQVIAYKVGPKGKLSERRIFAKMEGDDPAAKGGADGMTIDRAGNVYCAGPSDIWIWSPDGQLLDKIPCPTRPVNCAFGGSALRDLYITGLGGVYLQKMRTSGVTSHPPASWYEKNAKLRPSVILPKGITPHYDLTYARYGTRKMLSDIYVPSGDGPHPAVVILHGGGWYTGDKAKFRAMGIDLARRGYVAMAIAYRLSGEAKFPANIQDCHAAVRYLRAHATDYKVDADRIGVVGGSAGAHLAGLLATTANVPALHGNGGNASVSSAVQAAVLISGPMEIATGSVAQRSLIKNNPKPAAVWLFGGNVEEMPEAYALADAHQHIDKHTPPILFQYGGAEDPSIADPSLKKLKQFGIATKLLSNYKDGTHGCWNRLPWFTPMMNDIDAWFREHL